MAVLAVLVMASSGETLAVLAVLALATAATETVAAKKKTMAA
jgi:hypothetical protein